MVIEKIVSKVEGMCPIDPTLPLECLCKIFLFKASRFKNIWGWNTKKYF